MLVQVLNQIREAKAGLTGDQHEVRWWKFHFFGKLESVVDLFQIFDSIDFVPDFDNSMSGWVNFEIFQGFQDFDSLLDTIRVGDIDHVDYYVLKN